MSKKVLLIVLLLNFIYLVSSGSVHAVSFKEFLQRFKKKPPKPTPTLQVLPTPTGIVTPTVTSVPSGTPTPTAASGSSSSSSSSLPIPLCTDHSDTAWHPLVRYYTDGSVKCTYGHEHHDDPSVLDSVFGPVGQYTGENSISYPWQTHTDTGTENGHKHNAYKWSVVSVEECKPSYAPLGFTKIRGEFHQDAAPGALIRFHSFWLEAQSCDPKDPGYKGIVRMGGLMDYGRLSVTNGNNTTVFVPLPEDPSSGDDVRLHMGYVNGTVPCCRNQDFTWYGSNRNLNVSGLEKVYVRNGLRGEDWGAIDPNNLTSVIFNPTLWYGERMDGNNSWQEPLHLLNITVPSSFDDNDGIVDGTVSFNGYTDRNGNILNASCSPVGIDCIPIVLENMKIGNYQFRADFNSISTREYDIVINGQSSIQYPN